MGLSAVVQQGVESAFNAIGDLVLTGTFHPYGDGGSYDPVTEKRTGGDLPAQPNIRVVITALENHEAGEVMPVTEKKLLAPTQDFSNPLPRQGDAFEVTGTMWRVTRVLHPPGSAIVKLAVRQE